MAPLRFSSENALVVPTCEEITEHSVTRRRVCLSERRYRMDVRIWLLPHGGSARGQMRVQRMYLSCGMSAQRTRELVSDGNDDIVLQIHQTGRRIVSQRRREAIAEPGAGIFISNAEESAVVIPGQSRSIGIALSRTLMTALCPALEDALLRPIPSDSGALGLLLRYLDVFDEADALATPELRSMAGTHIHDLCALALGSTREAAEIACVRGVRAARMRAIKADISVHLGGDVSAPALALRQGVTPRYLHKLFESEGVTLSRYVLGQRLAQVHRRLAHAGSADLTIGAIAYAAGFCDLSTFNREFRRHFGTTPSDVRATACGRSAARRR